MSVELLNFIETVLNGLMSGIMYSLVALGFVLIFKASGVFNFAQGVFALFAALTLVGFQTGQVPFSHLINELFGTKLHHWYPEIHSFLAIIFTIITMIVLAWIIERLVLKHLVNQVGGSGGGRPDFAQGGADNPEDIEVALDSVTDLVVSLTEQ